MTMPDPPEPVPQARAAAEPPSLAGGTRLARWVRDYAPDLHRFLAKRRLIESDIQDVCQEVYLRLLRFDRTEVATNPQAYLIRVAANVAHDFRLRRLHWAALDPELPEEASPEPGPERLAELSSRQGALMTALATLPPLPRAVLALQAREDLTYEQIADRLGVTRRSVKRAVARGLELLRDQMREAK
jgi:RNA polymerase sigma factor (sigma-70 family)